MHITNDNLIAEGDRVAQKWTLRGTHAGQLYAIPPTGRQVTFSGVTFLRLGRTERGLRIVERWSDYDAMGLMRQLGVVPA
jgi:predicted ester cyclase